MKLCLFNSRERAAAIVGCGMRHFDRLVEAFNVKPVNFARSSDDVIFKFRAEDVLRIKKAFAQHQHFKKRPPKRGSYQSRPVRAR